MRLPFLPREEGYTAAPANSTIDVVELEGGQSLRRRVLDNNMIRFQVSYQLKRHQYEFLIAFYEQWLRDRTPSGRLKYFDALLIYQPTNPEYPLHNFKCIFIEEPLVVSNAEGLDITVSTVLEGYFDNWWPMSALYPIMGIGDLRINNPSATLGIFWRYPAEGLNFVTGLIEGELRQQTFHNYSTADEFNFLSTSFVDGTITQFIFHNASWADDDLEMKNVSFVEGTIRSQLVTYTNYAPEGFKFDSMKLEEGTLS